MNLFIAIGFAQILFLTAAKLALAGDQRSRFRSRHTMLEAVRGTGGVVLKTSLNDSKEKALRDTVATAPPISSTSRAA